MLEQPSLDDKARGAARVFSHFLLEDELNMCHGTCRNAEMKPFLLFHLLLRFFQLLNLLSDKGLT